MLTETIYCVIEVMDIYTLSIIKVQKGNVCQSLNLVGG
jgi:hypothetical protein